AGRDAQRRGGGRGRGDRAAGVAGLRRRGAQLRPVHRRRLRLQLRPRRRRDGAQGLDRHALPHL
ncbi:MAG: hypothetical protein AVDCRST_MAG06-1589, partial [uncultured Nocardioides sp.]